MTAGGGVYDNPIVAALLHPRGDLQKGHELIQARQGEVQEAADLLVIEKGSARGDFPEFRVVGRLEGVEILPGIQFQYLQVVGGTAAGQAIRERVGGIGGNKKKR
ncbi:MAG: hypothetical protein LAO07_19360 [Acidobacteriia bacterium]|nr:hypothetical protein [Terriglobia bacterium]